MCARVCTCVHRCPFSLSGYPECHVEKDVCKACVRDSLSFGRFIGRRLLKTRAIEGRRVILKKAVAFGKELRLYKGLRQW